MKNTITVMAAILLIGIGTAHAGDQTSRWLSPNDPTAKLITVVETMWAGAACGPQPAALKDAIADDFQGTSTKGERYPKFQALETGHDRDCHLQQIKIRLFGDSLAMVYGNENRIDKKQDGTEWKRCQAWTDTWLKRDGKWQIIAAQDAIVTCEKP